MGSMFGVHHTRAGCLRRFGELKKCTPRNPHSHTLMLLLMHTLSRIRLPNRINQQHALDPPARVCKGCLCIHSPEMDCLFASSISCMLLTLLLMFARAHPNVPQHTTCNKQLAAYNLQLTTCSYDAMLDLKGNTAVYLLYAHARIAGIARKVRSGSLPAVGAVLL